MSRMTTFIVHEAESFLRTYEDRIRKKEKNIPMAHLAQTSPTPTTDQSFVRGGRNGRAMNRGGGRNGKGGRFSNNRPQCELCGHLATWCKRSLPPQPQQYAVPYANSYPPPPPHHFINQGLTFTAPSTYQHSTWFVDSGALYHVTTEHANIMQHSNSNHTPEQLYVGNEK
ncbi:hypothetical protein PIB30_042170 [Stylosanthes scabra]|uniref:Uncharacterized protein n=1 Tax=Stylosanthes scabra TaxID=79078 RepID=A0ABU6RF77_9FABA|nr:hypothetical protein [Stylosanthes scabra]